MAFQPRQGTFQRTGVRTKLTTAHLAQTMTLLGMNALELLEKIEGELANNPALELVEGRHCPNCNRRLPSNSRCPKCSYQGSAQGEEPIVFVSPPEQNYTYSGSTGRFEDIDSDVFSPDTEDLATYVLQQIADEIAPADREIAVHIASSLDKDGLLSIPIMEIARYRHVDPERVYAIIDVMQRADPIGVASGNEQEALLVQLDVLGDKVPHPVLARRAVEEGFQFLTKKQFSELGRLLKISKGEAESLANFIGDSLNPYPARAFWGNTRHISSDTAQVYQRPDVIMRCAENSEDTRLIVEIMWPIRGMLRINPDFKRAITEAPENKADKWKADMEQANLLVKCLSQRNHTLVRLMQKLAKIQREFILAGPAHIQPITRVQLAEDLEVHESTISRAVSGKTVQLPSGHIIPISQFFDRSLHIRTALKGIVESEDAPLSDTKIALLLKKQGYKIARRTVAKYRSMEGILPAHLRKVQTKQTA